MFIHPETRQEFETLLRETDASPLEVKELLSRRNNRRTVLLLAWLKNMDVWSCWGRVNYPKVDSYEYKRFLQVPELWTGPIWVERNSK
jgi:hypothetical protein